MGLDVEKLKADANSAAVKALIDGMALPNQIIRNEGVINGDSFIPSIQAASIFAKVTRFNL